MSDEEIQKIALQVICRVLEEAAFIFTNELNDNERPAAQSWDATGVSLSFTGASKGELHMWAGSAFCRFAAANMLGIDDENDSAAAKGMDALKEILNMVVGNFITSVYGEEQVFDLGLPRQLPAQALEKDYAAAKSVWLQAEGNPVLFIICIS